MKHFRGRSSLGRPQTARTIASDISSRPTSHVARRASAVPKQPATAGTVYSADVTALPVHRSVAKPITDLNQCNLCNSETVPGSSRRLQRLLSHSIDVQSDLSSSDTELEVAGPAQIAGQHDNAQQTLTTAHSTPTDRRGIRHRRKRHSTTHPVSSCHSHQPQQQPQPASQQRPQESGCHSHHPQPQQPGTPPKPARAAAKRGTQRSAPSQWHASAGLSALSCVLLLVACGSTLRAVSSWQRARSSEAPIGNFAVDSGASWWGSSSWLSTSPAGPAAAAAGHRVGAVGGGFWLPQGVRQSLSSTASHLRSHFSTAAASVTHNTAGFTVRASRSRAWLSSGGSWLPSFLHSSHPGLHTAAADALTSSSPPSGSPRSSSKVSTRAATTAMSSESSGSSSVGAAGSIKMYAIIDGSAPSPFKSHSPKNTQGLDWSANWGEVVTHMAQRLEWTDPRFSLEVVTQDELKGNAAAREALSRALLTPNPSASAGSSSSSPIFIGIGITDPDVAAFVAKTTSQLPTALFWNSAPSLASSNRVDGYSPQAAGPLAKLLADNVPFSREAKAAEVLKTLDVLWARDSSDDLLYIWLVLLNQYVTPVPMVANTTKGTDLASLFCMIKNCGQKIVDCVTDKTCKTGLDCLQNCAFNDQVCQYRCIVSYETPQFEQFALCILQLHNCRGLNAEVPMRPDVAPMTQWRGQALTHELAEDLFIGWLSDGPQLPSPDAQLKPYSWLVAAGKNPAYDAFGCQHQLYYRGKGKGQMWYEPVFRVTTLEGQEVWRRRRYRVRRGSTPGTFHYSVLDNGVTSNEFWRIVDCAEDLTYCLFYYSGAAAAAGMSYTGAVLATPDGLWPSAYTERIHGALRQAGIEPWELAMPDNSRCADAPLAA